VNAEFAALPDDIDALKAALLAARAEAAAAIAQCSSDHPNIKSAHQTLLDKRLMLSTALASTGDFDSPSLNDRRMKALRQHLPEPKSVFGQFIVSRHVVVSIHFVFKYFFQPGAALISIFASGHVLIIDGRLFTIKPSMEGLNTGTQTFLISLGPNICQRRCIIAWPVDHWVELFGGEAYYSPPAGVSVFRF